MDYICLICQLATQSLSAFTLLFSCFKEMCFIQIIDLTTSSLLWKSIKHSLPIIVVLGLLMTNWKSKYVYQKLLLVDENYGLHRKTRRDRQKQTPLISCTPFKQKNLSTSPSTHLKLLIKKQFFLLYHENPSKSPKTHFGFCTQAGNFSKRIYFVTRLTIKS